MSEPGISTSYKCLRFPEIALRPSSYSNFIYLSICLSIINSYYYYYYYLTGRLRRWPGDQQVASWSVTGRGDVIPDFQGGVDRWSRPYAYSNYAFGWKMFSKCSFEKLICKSDRKM
jgi:hypothetical protein